MEDRVQLGRKAFDLGLRLGVLGPVLIGSSGGALASALARSIGCGAALAGAEARFHDGSCEACGVWLAGFYALPSAVFVRQEGSGVSILTADASGRELHPVPAEITAPCTGSWDRLTGADSGWAARRALERCGPALVSAEGPPALRLLLERMGCDVLDRPRPGVPMLRSDPGGFRLAVWHSGITEHPTGQDALAAAANWLSRRQAVPAFGTELI